MTSDEFYQQLEAEKRQEAEKYAAFSCRFSITIYEDIRPLARGEKYEVPLQKALGESGVVIGGGSSMKEIDGKMVITDVGFSVRTKELEKGLGIIRKTLNAQQAPKNTKIKLTEPREEQYGLDE